MSLFAVWDQSRGSSEPKKAERSFSRSLGTHNENVNRLLCLLSPNGLIQSKLLSFVSENSIEKIQGQTMRILVLSE
jgi:hypothetical protein